MKPAKSLLPLVLLGGLACCVSPRCSADSPPARLGWWNDAVFYQVFVRSFQDSSLGPLSGDGVGDIVGLIEKLDYLNDGDESTDADLGVRGLWLMPVAESSHPAGFAVVDYETIERDYGTNDDFRRLMAETHRRGIRVIVDLVLNHTAAEHPWFVAAADPDSPYHDYYVWRDAPPGDWDAVAAKRWYEHPNGKWFYARFGSGVPDLNLSNPAVTRELYETARFWLKEMDVDGFRLDAIKHLFEDGPVDEHVGATHDWIRAFFQHCKATKPDCYLVGEVWSDTEAVAAYGPDEVDMAFQFELAGAFLTAAREGRAGALAGLQKRVRDLHAPLQHAPFLANHDMTRAMEQLGRDPNRMRVAATLLLTAPGVPFVYYGEEVGIAGADGKGRSPMQWDASPYAGFSSAPPYRPFDVDADRFNVASQSADEASILAAYRQLVRLRNESTALRHGRYVELHASTPDEEESTAEASPLYAFARKVGDEAVVAVINLSDRDIAGYAISGGESLGSAAGATEAIDLVTGDAVPVPDFDDSGRFKGYRPFDSMAPSSWRLIRISR